MNVLILSSSEGMSISLARCLSLSNSESHVINIWKTLGTAKFSRFCKRYTSYSPPESIHETEKLGKAIDEYCQRNFIDIILPAVLLGTFILAIVKDKLNYPKIYPIPTPEQIYFLHNKWLFYKFLSQYDIPTPKTILIKKEDEVDLLSSLRFPLMLKPLGLGNGKGIQRVESIEEVVNYISNSGKYNELPLLLQEYVPGSDIVFGILAKDGKLIAWTMHERTSDFLRFFRNDSILNLGQKIVALCNYTGLANFDLRLDVESGSIKVIECNPRFWASAGSSVFYGVDFVNLGILLSQGKTEFSDLKTEVNSTEDCPHHTPRKFLKGLIYGKYSLDFSRKNLAWQTLSDPMPVLVHMMRARFGLTNLYDSEIMEKLMEDSTQKIFEKF